MINETELIAIERRAHALRLSMSKVCLEADKWPQSWFRARKRGRADYTLIDPIEKALDRLEKERDQS